MPSRLEHELNKLRGEVSATGEVYTSSLAALQDALTEVEKAIESLNTDEDTLQSKVSQALHAAYSALSNANASIKYSDRSINLNSLIALQASGIRIYSEDLSASAYISATGGYSSFSKVKTNVIDELTGLSGVTIDSVLLKDGNVDGRDVSTDGTKLDTIDTNADVTGSNPPQAHGSGSHSNRNRSIFLTPVHTTGSFAAKGANLDGGGGSEYATFVFQLPADFVSIVSLHTVMLRTAALTGGVVCDILLNAGEAGENSAAHNTADNDVLTTIANGNLYATALDHATLLASVTQDDYIYIKVTRTSADGNDTYAADMTLYGLRLVYSGDM